MTLIASFYLYAITALMPVVRPALPFSTTVFDYVNVAFMALLLLCLSSVGKIEFRLLAPMFVILLGSLFSMLNTEAPGANILTLLKEGYLLCFFWTIYNLVKTKRLLETVAVSWMIVAGVEGALVIAEYLLGGTLRAQGTFANENMAASYLGTSLFVVLYPFERRHLLVRGCVLVLCTGGIVATNSISAILGWSVSGGVMACLYVIYGSRRQNALLGLIGAGIVIVISSAVAQSYREHDYLARLPRSFGGRFSLWSVGTQEILQNPMGIGFGPGSFKEVGFIPGGEWGTGHRGELHSDYLSFLVERGLIGFCGLVCLVATLGGMCWRCIQLAPTEAELMWALGLCGMLVFTLTDSISHEVLHYRHVWLTVGLIAVQRRLSASYSYKIRTQ